MSFLINEFSEILSLRPEFDVHAFFELVEFEGIGTGVASLCHEKKIFPKLRRNF